jgi:hypothetical protein
LLGTGGSGLRAARPRAWVSGGSLLYALLAECADHGQRGVGADRRVKDREGDAGGAVGSQPCLAACHRPEQAERVQDGRSGQPTRRPSPSGRPQRRSRSRATCAGNPRDIGDTPPGLGGPFLPGLPFRTPGLEHQIPARAKRGVNAQQRTRSVLISEKDLRHVSRHHRKISIEGRQCRGIAVDPGDSCADILRSGDLKRCAGWVCTHDSTAAFSEQDRQAACPATDIEHALRAQFVGDAEVGSQIIAVSVKGVIDRCKARVSKIASGTRQPYVRLDIAATAFRAATVAPTCRGQGRVRGHDKILAMPRGQSATEDGG